VSRGESYWPQSPPFAAHCAHVVPSDGRPTVNLQAQAVDGEGEVGYSDVLTLTIH